MIFQSGAVNGKRGCRWLIDLQGRATRRGGRERGEGEGGGKTDGEDHDQVPLTDLCCRTEQDLSRERSTCCCWCRRHGDFWPDRRLGLPASETVSLHGSRSLLLCSHGESVSKRRCCSRFDGWSSHANRTWLYWGGRRRGAGVCWNTGMCMFGKEACSKRKLEIFQYFHGLKKTQARHWFNISSIKPRAPHNIKSRAIYGAVEAKAKVLASAREVNVWTILLPKTSLNSNRLLAHRTPPVTVWFTQSNSHNVFRGVCYFTLPRRRAKYDKSLE